MAFSTELIALAHFMAGEFENKEQAIADPVWYVHLRLWNRPLPIAIFSESITLFAEQANVLTPNQAYRPRVIQLYQAPENPNFLSAQYYLPKDLAAVRSAGSRPELLKQLISDQLELLPTCKLTVTCQSLGLSSGQTTYRFKANLPENTYCNFNYQGQNYQVDLGFEASPDVFLSFDRGIDPKTEKAIWGALLGPYRFIKGQDFSHEIPNI
ncbi:MAG: chromophore lyase CpcT/CpeT [Microcoleaceae cyanobacterium]